MARYLLALRKFGLRLTTSCIFLLLLRSYLDTHALVHGHVRSLERHVFALPLAVSVLDRAPAVTPDMISYMSSRAVSLYSRIPYVQLQQQIIRLIPLQRIQNDYLRCVGAFTFFGLKFFSAAGLKCGLEYSCKYVAGACPTLPS